MAEATWTMTTSREWCLGERPNSQVSWGEGRWDQGDKKQKEIESNMVSQGIREGKIADEGGGVQSYMYYQLQMYACSVYKIHCKTISKVEISNLRAFFGDMYFIVLWYFIILQCLYSLPLFLLPSTHIFLFHSKCNYLFLACHCQFFTISRQHNQMFNKLWCDWMF